MSPHKSTAITIGRWSALYTVLGVAYHSYVIILNVTFWTSTDKSINGTWARPTAQVRLRARESYPRDLCLAHRLRYVHTYVFAKIWYIAQIFPAPGMYNQRLTSAATFIWKGATLRFPVSTLQRHKTGGRWGLVDVAAKCRVPLVARMYLQGTREGTGTASWLQAWRLIGI